VSVLVFAAVAGSAGLIAQLDTAVVVLDGSAGRRLTVGGLLATAFLTLTATAGNLGVLLYIVHELGTNNGDSAARIPLEYVLILFASLIVAAAVASSAYATMQLMQLGKGPEKRHPAMP
jgi:hypothetical protein